MSKDLITDHQDIIDEWSVNGWNGVQAVLKYRPHLSYGTASAVMIQILKNPNNQAYIKEYRDNLKSKAQIENEVILMELKNFALSDVGTYAGLSLDEFKNLPPDIRRCVDTFEEVTKTYTTRDGKEVKETKLKIKLIDKLKAIDMIGRHIDFFNADNASKQPSYDMTNKTPEELNTVLSAIEILKTSKKQLKP